ncbi:MAG: PHP domain-containing protein [Clostridia bacterium]|nr:PHP domain-containing protein [Clostridia bacterium]
MSTYYYDFHLHSCLSPCADDDMTPNNIAGMGTICGLQIMALTDHNTTKNCPAFFEAAARQGIIPIAGMELTTAEDIHLCCLFETLEQAAAFEDAMYPTRMLMDNRPDIFGDQMIMNGQDEVIGIEPHFLPNATTLSLEQAAALCVAHGGVCYPAHIDRPANGIVATLGTFPTDPPFGLCEVHDADRIDELKNEHPSLQDVMFVSGSDAHYLWDIREKCCSLEIDDEPYSSELVRRKVFEQLRKAAHAMEGYR